jgi:hypothetical protein
MSSTRACPRAAASGEPRPRSRSRPAHGPGGPGLRALCRRRCRSRRPLERPRPLSPLAPRPRPEHLASPSRPLPPQVQHPVPRQWRAPVRAQGPQGAAQVEAHRGAGRLLQGTAGLRRPRLQLLQHRLQKLPRDRARVLQVGDRGVAGGEAQGRRGRCQCASRHWRGLGGRRWAGSLVPWPAGSLQRQACVRPARSTCVY